jgi:hypothetical protein
MNNLHIYNKIKKYFDRYNVILYKYITDIEIKGNIVTIYYKIPSMLKDDINILEKDLIVHISMALETKYIVQIHFTNYF